MARQTIRRGSTGPDVDAWQALMKLKVDSNFGPLTEQKTIDWQRANNLVADGVVGPVSWATAEGTPIPAVKTSMAGADATAYAVAKRAMPELTERERQYALTVARGEGGYGLGWAHPSAQTIEASKAFGLTGYEGTGSNNWGADQGTGSAGSFKHVDYHADGKPYVGTYAKQKTPEEGFARMARIILNGGKRGAAGAAEIRSAINAGDLPAAVFAQHRNGYFELAPEKYLAAVLRNYGVLTTNIGWSKLFGGAAAIGGAGLAVAGTLVLGGLLWWARSKG
jgi:hypothetical protein